MSRLRQSLLFFFLLSCASSAFAKDQETFAPSEHVTLGDNVQIRLSANDSGQVGHIFHLPNGLDVSYGDLVAMGDFYEIVDKPIAFGKNEAERRSRFLTAFHSFAQSPSAVSEAKQILAVIHNEKKAVEDAVSRGENPEDVYQKMGKDNNRQYNCITGGGCSPSTWWTQPGRYLNLASSNYDHFGDYAWIAYQTGHQLALEQAILARQTQDPAKLELAYAMNAFATHFLSDRFSAGHMRTPRKELADKVTPATVGSLLSNYMHNEENINSLHVHNRRGDHWIAYGDGSYFNQKNKMHRAHIQETVQLSADQVFIAYQQGEAQNDEHLFDLIPEADETGNASNQDLSPLFYWNSKTQKLMRREDVSNLYDRHWTDNWWGWSTLALLSQDRGLPTRAQAALVQAGYGEEALQAGLLTDKDIVNYVKKAKAK